MAKARAKAKTKTKTKTKKQKKEDSTNIAESIVLFFNEFDIIADINTIMSQIVKEKEVVKRPSPSFVTEWARN